MPTPSSSQRHELNRDPIRSPHIILLEFQEDGKSLVHRAAINTEDVVCGGNTYSRAAIQIELPETRDGETRARGTISNVDRFFSRAMDSARQRVNCRLILINVDAPDVALIDTMNLLVIPNASGRSESISFELAPRAGLLEPVPFKQTTKQDFPGIWLG
jgi:hypothetical protein